VTDEQGCAAAVYRYQKNIAVLKVTALYTVGLLNTAAYRPAVYWATVCHLQYCDIFWLRDTLIEVATPYAPPLSSRGYHTLTWRSHGHSVAAYL